MWVARSQLVKRKSPSDEGSATAATTDVLTLGSTRARRAQGGRGERGPQESPLAQSKRILPQCSTSGIRLSAWSMCARSTGAKVTGDAHPAQVRDRSPRKSAGGAKNESLGAN